MRLHLKPYTLIVAVVVALGMLVSGAGVASGAENGDRTLRIVAKEVQSKFLDLGDKGPSLGDQLIISEKLYRDHWGKEEGHSGIVCTVVHAEEPFEVLTFQCLATLWLEDGQITLQGLIKARENDEGPFTVAITGGTDEFRDASGEAVIRDEGDKSIYELYFSH